MLSIVGTYQNGHLELDREYKNEAPVKVIVTFLEKVNDSSSKRLQLSDFSFSKSQDALKGYKGSFTEEVIEERRKEQ